MVPDLPIQEGKAACAGFVREVLAGLLERFNRQITYVSAEVRIIGDFAFDRGSFRLTASPKSGGETTRETGKYLFLYSRARDSSWKIARAIVSLDERDGD
jgi:ketosteroid isomerase-like protein